MTNIGAMKNSETSLGQILAEAISAIEGQVLTDEQRSRFREWDAASLSLAQQRADIMCLYRQQADLR